MTYKVRGGTHLNIVSCYGEKEFKANNFGDLVEQIRDNIGIKPDVGLFYDKNLNRWRFDNNLGHTLFEFEVI